MDGFEYMVFEDPKPAECEPEQLVSGARRRQRRELRRRQRGRSSSISSRNGMPSRPISGICGFNCRERSSALRCTATSTKPRF
ncbi:MAG: hypothetical protein JXQ73_11940 [Phycisphaerae bacterium]|nr:hypothetical protein [Phycisphaerae bacterium]